MENFTPAASLLGGALIGSSAAMLLALNGKIAGVSGIAGGLVAPATKGDGAWRVAFIVGLLLAGAAAAVFAPAQVTTLSRPTTILVAAGLLVGIGTRMGSGCTSGHGVCGLSRLSRRSLVATVTFLVAGAITVFFSHPLLGGAP